MRKLAIIVIILILLSVSLVTISFIFVNNAKKATLTGEITKVSTPSNESKVLENNKEIINAAKSHKYLPVDRINSDDHILGSSTALVQIIIYDDYADPFLRQLEESIGKVKKVFQSKVLIAKRFYIYNNNDLNISAIKSSLCAGEQNKFWEMDGLLVRDSLAREINADVFQKNANDLHLDIEAFNKCFSNKEMDDKIMAFSKSAEKYGVLGVPTIFVNDEFLPGAYPFEDFIDSTKHKRKGLKTIIEEKLTS